MVLQWFFLQNKSKRNKCILDCFPINASPSSLPQWNWTVINFQNLFLIKIAIWKWPHSVDGCTCIQKTAESTLRRGMQNFRSIAFNVHVNVFNSNLYFFVSNTVLNALIAPFVYANESQFWLPFNFLKQQLHWLYTQSKNYSNF